MDADEAARTAEMLGLEIAVACHYLAKDAEVDRFLELVPHYDTTGRRQAVAPEVGQTPVVERSGGTHEEAQAEGSAPGKLGPPSPGGSGAVGVPGGGLVFACLF